MPLATHTSVVPHGLLSAADKSLVAFAQLVPSPVPLAVGLTYNTAVKMQILIVKALLVSVTPIWQELFAIKTHAMTSPFANALLLYVGLFVPTFTLFKSH